MMNLDKQINKLDDFNNSDGITTFPQYFSYRIVVYYRTVLI